MATKRKSYYLLLIWLWMLGVRGQGICDNHALTSFLRERFHFLWHVLLIKYTVSHLSIDCETTRLDLW